MVMDRIESNNLHNQIEERYVYGTFKKRKYDFTSVLDIRRLVHQKNGFQ